MCRLIWAFVLQKSFFCLSTHSIIAPQSGKKIHKCSVDSNRGITYLVSWLDTARAGGCVTHIWGSLLSYLQSWHDRRTNVCVHNICKMTQKGRILLNLICWNFLQLKSKIDTLLILLGEQGNTCESGKGEFLESHLLSARLEFFASHFYVILKKHYIIGALTPLNLESRTLLNFPWPSIYISRLLSPSTLTG